MKLKYYMRGLGIGIVLTTLILAIARPKEELTDQEIVRRAKALGMGYGSDELNSEKNQVLNGILDNGEDSQEPGADTAPGEGTDPEAGTKQEADGNISESGEDTETGTNIGPEEETGTEANIVSGEDTETGTSTEPGENTETGTNTIPGEEAEAGEEATPEVTSEQDPSEGLNPAEELITFTVVRGMYSGEVSKVLEEAGLIQDAKDFNQYIIKKGKASVIRVGSFTLPMGATYDEIIKEITE
ncbi:hypothetical protein HNQ56_003173 [Anaerotaenia torta]|uniref:hypothetical protein n=1 Tax=Anaerotaenia torta TaxID=433293 RepID=UPI003D1E1F56